MLRLKSDKLLCEAGRFYYNGSLYTGVAYSVEHNHHVNNTALERWRLKMSIKVWSNKVLNDEDFTEAKVRDMSLLKGLKLTVGNSLKSSWPKIILDVTSDFPPSDTFFSGPMLIVNKKLAGIIFEFVSYDEVEYLPVSVAYNGRIKESYGVLNILSRVDAVDRDNSEYTEGNGFIDSIHRLSIDENKIGQKALFRLDAIERVICVQETLVCRIESERIAGVVFKNPSEWRPY